METTVETEAAASSAKEVEATRKLLETRTQLREANLRPAPHRLAGPKLKELKSDVKKATAFSKKAKAFAADQLPALTTDLSTINVSMFISEVAQALPLAIYDGKMKTGDVPAFVQFWSLLHQKYDKFSADALTQLKKGFSLDGITAEMEAKLDMTAPPSPDAAKPRMMIRTWLELWIAGVLPSAAFVDTVLGKLIASLDASPTHHVTANMIAFVLLIVRTAGPELVPSLCLPSLYSIAAPGSTTKPVDSGQEVQSQMRSDESTKQCYTKDSERAALMKKLVLIFDKSKEFTLKLKKQLEVQWRQMCENTEMRGELPAEVTEKFGKVRAEVERIIALVNQLGACVGKMTPDDIVSDVDLSKALAKSNVDEGVVFQSGLQDFYNVKQIESVNRFDDDDQRAFYEQLLDVDEHLIHPSSNAAPAAATAGALPSAAAKGDIAAEGETLSSAVGELDDTENTAATVLSATDKADLDYSELEGLFKKLRQAAAREYIDKWMVEFLFESQRYMREGTNPQQAQSFFNNAMRMLVAELRFSPTNSNEMLPFMARVIATFTKKFSDMGAAIASKLEGEVQHLVREKQQNVYGRKIRNVRYVCELVKFRVAPPIRVFRLMHLCLDDWENGHNVEMFSLMLENVGPYLMRGGVTKDKMDEILAIAKEKERRIGVKTEHEALLENARATCRAALNPKRMTKLIGAVRTPLEQYLRYLLFSALKETNFKAVRDKVRRMPWNRDSEGTLCCGVLRKAYLCSWDRVHLLAEIVADVSDVHGWVAVNIVDAIIESLRLDLEHGFVRSQQKQIQDLKYLGELYNFRLVSFHTLYYVMAQLMLFHPKKQNPTDYTRIRLVCTLLETAGAYLLQKKELNIKSRIAMSTLMTYFFQFTHTHTRPLPLDLDYKLLDVVGMVTQAINSVKGETTRLVFPPTAAAANEAVAAVKQQLIKNSKYATESWLLELVTAMESASATGTSGTIYSVSKRMAPAEMDTEDTSKREKAPLHRPVEAKLDRDRGDDSDEESDSDSDDDSDDSDDDDLSSGSDDSDSSDEESDEEDDEEDEEEEEEDFFSRGQFTRGGNWGPARVSDKKDVSEEDREFAELLMQARRDAVSNTKAGARGVAGKQTIDRSMEDKLPASLAPYMQRVRTAPPSATSATRTSDQPTAPSSTGPHQDMNVQFAVLKRGANDRIEAKALYVPAESDFAVRTAEAQGQEERAKADLARQVLSLSKQQREQEVAEQQASFRMRGRGGRGGGGGGGRRY